jgi:hypothetical protein
MVGSGVVAGDLGTQVTKVAADKVGYLRFCIRRSGYLKLKTVTGTSVAIPILKLK